MEKEIFTNVVDKAKDLFETTKKKAGETVSVEKLKFNVSSLKSKRDKEYIKLGIAYYEILKDSPVDDENIGTTVNTITDYSTQIENLNCKINEIKAKRICPACGASVNENDSFCSSCGAKIIFDSKE